MKKTRFLTLEQIIVVHNDQIERYGGSHGIHDLNLLESATMRPQTSFGGKYLYESVFDKCAAMIHSLIMNHPFVDGNKRTATACGLVFLELNGNFLETEDEDLLFIILSVSQGKIEVRQLSAWLRKHCSKID